MGGDGVTGGATERQGRLGKVGQNEQNLSTSV